MASPDATLHPAVLGCELGAHDQDEGRVVGPYHEDDDRGHIAVQLAVLGKVLQVPEEGVLSYFEYMYVRPLRKVIADKQERTRLNSLEEIMGSFLTRYRFHTSWVLVNLPPAWVQHLQNDGEKSAPVSDVDTGS